MQLLLLLKQTNRSNWKQNWVAKRFKQSFEKERWREEKKRKIHFHRFVNAKWNISIVAMLRQRQHISIFTSDAREWTIKSTLYHCNFAAVNWILNDEYKTKQIEQISWPASAVVVLSYLLYEKMSMKYFMAHVLLLQLWILDANFQWLHMPSSAIIHHRQCTSLHLIRLRMSHMW